MIKKKITNFEIATLNYFVTGKGKSGWAEFYGSSYSVGKY